MKTYLIYETATGRITQVSQISDYNLSAWTLPAGFSMIQADGDDATHYIYNGQVVGRPLMDTHPTIISKTDNVAEDEVITITGVPSGADIYIDGVKYNLAAGETVLELSFNLAGKYAIKIVSFPYQDWDREVTVI